MGEVDQRETGSRQVHRNTLHFASRHSLELPRASTSFHNPILFVLVPILVCFGSLTAALPINNTKRRDDSPICSPVSWEQIVIFILVNYVTHAVTVKTYPGERKSETAMCIAAALLWPYSGAFKAFQAISTGARSAADPLQMALHAEALCVVARNPQDSEDPWSPEVSNEVGGTTRIQLRACWPPHPNAAIYDGPAKVKVIGDEYQWRVNPHVSKVHGQFYLPKGYHFHRLVNNERVQKESKENDIELASSVSTPKVIASLIQICAAVVTLYRSRGMQIQLFGWGAFGFSVIPYALMSIVNLFGNLISPEYSAIYMVRSEIMDEAISRGGIFVGMVGVMPVRCPSLGEDEQRPRAVGTEPTATTQTAPVIDNAAPGIPNADNLGPAPENFRRTGSNRICGKPPDVGEEMIDFKLNSTEQDDSTNGSNNRRVYTYDANSNTIIRVPSRGCREIVLHGLYQKMWLWLVFVVGAVVVATPYIIIFAMTQYHRGTESTGLQRAFMEAWLVLGQIAGLVCICYIWISNNVSRWKRYLGFIVLACIGGVSSIGGFVMVGEEIHMSELCVIL